MKLARAFALLLVGVAPVCSRRADKRRQHKIEPSLPSFRLVRRSQLLQAIVKERHLSTAAEDARGLQDPRAQPSHFGVYDNDLGQLHIGMGDKLDEANGIKLLAGASASPRSG